VGRYLKELRREYGRLSWLIPISREEWDFINKRSIYGVTRGHRAIKRIIEGDLLVFYVPRTKGGDLGGKIVSVYRVASKWSENYEPMFRGEREAQYPIRASLELVKSGIADFWKLVPLLSFVKQKSNPSFYLMGTPANMNRPIPERDLKIIIEDMKQSS